MVQSREENGRLIISLSGEIDSSNAQEVETRINEIRQEHPVDSIELDCDRLKYASSAGLRVMLGLHRSLPMGGKTKVTNCNSVIKEVFSVTGFDGILEIS